MSSDSSFRERSSSLTSNEMRASFESTDSAKKATQPASSTPRKEEKQKI